MAGSDEQERIAYYQSREQVGPYLSKLYSFFPGQPTIPNNATANKAIYINNGLGPGAKILNGITPFVPEPLPCDEVVLTDLSVVFVDPTLTVTIEWNLLPGDIITLFNTSSGQVFVPVAVTPIVGGLELEFDMTSPPATVGSWSLKIARAENLDCFAVRSNVFQLTPAVCLIEAGAWTFPGGVPFPFVLFPGGGILSTEIHGTGFLSCPIGVSVVRVAGGGVPSFPVIGLTVVDDTLITFDVDTAGVAFGFSVYVAGVFCTDSPDCGDGADNFMRFGLA